MLLRDKPIKDKLIINKTNQELMHIMRFAHSVFGCLGVRDSGCKGVCTRISNHSEH